MQGAQIGAGGGLSRLHERKLYMYTIISYYHKLYIYHKRKLYLQATVWNGTVW